MIKLQKNDTNNNSIQTQDLVYIDLCSILFHEISDPHELWIKIIGYLKSINSLVNENGSLAIRTTGKFGYLVKLCVDSLLKEYELINEIYIHSFFTKEYCTNTFKDSTDRIFIFLKKIPTTDRNKRNLNPLYSKKMAKSPSWHGFDSKGQGKKMNFSITDEPFYLAPPVGSHWKWKQQTITEALKNYDSLPNDIKNDDRKFFDYIQQFTSLKRQERPKFMRLSKTNKPYYLVYGEQQLCNSFWDDIQSGSAELDSSDPEHKIYFTSLDLIERLVLIFTSESERVLLICNLKETEMELENRLKRIILIQSNISTISS